METVQRQKMTENEAINCGMGYLEGQSHGNEEMSKFIKLIAFNLIVDKETGIRYLISALCANFQAISEIIESLCGKTPQEFIKEDLKINFEDINLENVK